MHHLEDSSSDWEDLLARDDGLTEEDLVELRSHLSESIRDLVRVGLSDEEATLVALRRLGDPTALAVEYVKVSPGVRMTGHLYWAALGFVGFSIALGSVRLLSHAGTWMMRGTGSVEGWFLGLGFAALTFLFLAVVQTARVPHGRVARTVAWLVTRAQERPLATAHAAFSALAGLTILDYFATGFIWSIAWPDGYVARGALEAVLATGVPIGLFLLTGYLSRKFRSIAWS
jgi:hypothetical protein